MWYWATKSCFFFKSNAVRIRREGGGGGGTSGLVMDISAVNAFLALYVVHGVLVFLTLFQV